MIILNVGRSGIVNSKLHPILSKNSKEEASSRGNLRSLKLKKQTKNLHLNADRQP